MNLKEKVINKVLSLLGTENSRFVSYLNEYQEHTLIQKCTVSCSENKKVITQTAKEIFFEKKDNNISLTYQVTGKCYKCKAKLEFDVIFKNKPSFIFIEINPYPIFIHELPKIVRVDNQNYKLLCETIVQQGHFVSIFDLDNKFYTADDLDKSFNYLAPLEAQKKYRKHTKL